MNTKNITKNELVRINSELAAENAALRAELSKQEVTIKVLETAVLQARAATAQKADEVKAPAPKSRVVRVKEHVYATAEEFKAGLARVTEWAKTHEARISTSGLKIYVKTAA